MNAKKMTFRQRLAWLGRMPTKWRVLIGGQALIMTLAVSLRLKDIEKSIILQDQFKLQQEKFLEEAGAEAETAGK